MTEETEATITRQSKVTIGVLAILCTILMAVGGLVMNFTMQVNERFSSVGDRLKSLEVNQLVQSKSIEKMDKRLTELPSRQEYETIVRSEVQALRLEFMREMMNRERRSDEERKPPR